jgi:hypothetical protein
VSTISHADMASIAAALGGVAVTNAKGQPFGPTGKTPFGEWHDPMYVQMHNGGVSLLFDMRFTDRHGREHVFEAGLFSNGADIPSLAQPAVGGRLDGPYVRAAFGHDHWLKRFAADIAHALFYDAMRTDGCDEEQADLFFHAVTAKTWWNRMGALRGFLSSALRVVRRVIPRL